MPSSLVYLSKTAFGAKHIVYDDGSILDIVGGISNIKEIYYDITKEEYKNTVPIEYKLDIGSIIKKHDLVIYFKEGKKLIWSSNNNVIKD